MNLDITQLIVPAIAGIVGALGGALGTKFWQQRWVRRTDKKLDYLAEKIHLLIVMHAKSDGALQHTQKGVTFLNKEFGRLDHEVEKLKTTFEVKLGSATRASDI